MKEIKDFPGYFITEDGRVFSARKKIRGDDGRFKTFFNYDDLTELKPTIRPDGYYTVTLCSDEKEFKKRIHRLVAENYIENPNNLPQVNHINENKSNNTVSNLEWCDSQYNIEHSHSRWIWEIENSITGEIKTVTNVRKFARENNLDSSHLVRTFGKKNKTHKNFKIISKIQFK